MSAHEIFIHIETYQCNKCSPNLPCTFIAVGEVMGEPDICPYESSRYANWKRLEGEGTP